MSPSIASAAGRLSDRTLRGLPDTVIRPGYDRTQVSPGIVHLGVGAFHRAHQAVCVDDRLAAGETGWGIIGASLQSPSTRDALAPQDGLYTLAERDPQGERLRVIGSLSEVLVAPDDPQRLLQRLCDPRIRIVSLTVTEKGYCHDPATGALREDHPDILRDLSDPHTPRTVPGFLVEAIARRRAAGVAPFTVLCCDNLPANGRTVQRVLGAFAALRDPDLGRFVSGEVSCPATMVDRIVPATTDDDRDRIAAALGVLDAWPVAAEPFSQWVIEDRFSQGRPRLEDAGAELTADVAPYERMKLRLLNGSHSAIAYLGVLAGWETVSDAMSDPMLAGFVRDLMDEEITSTLSVPSGADLPAYKAALLERFRNPALRHRTAQIAMDGSQKLPQRLLGTIRERLAEGAPIDRLALAVAAFLRYATGIGEEGRRHDVRDPMAARLAACAGSLDGFLSIREIFGEDLPADPRFRSAISRQFARLETAGARRAVADMAERSR